MADVTTFAVIGTGWRCEFFLRLAAMAPDRFRAVGVLSRTQARAEEVATTWGVRGTTDLDDLLGHERPDLVIPSVTWEATPDVIRSLVERRVRVLAETPPAPDLDGLRALWRDVGGSDLVQVAEQYPRMPAHAARLAVARSGLLGDITSVQVSSTHLYHAVALFRAFLGTGFEPASVRANDFVAPLVDPRVPARWTMDAQPRPTATTIATLDFGDRSALYDFTDNQWWNPLRQRRIVVRGSAGELVDEHLVRMADASTPIDSLLLRRRRGTDLDLEGVDLEHLSLDGAILWRNAFLGSRFSEDDLAVADLLEAAGAWARDEGPAPYPLADGCQDHSLSLAILESARSGATVRTAVEPWAA